MIGRTNAGGAALNFKVVGGTAQPETAQENTIWVDTDTTITGWTFSAAEPAEPSEGMVWIVTGATAAAQFNALKTNSITVYPLLARQYVSGAWADKTAKSYQGGEWVDWFFYIIDGESLCEEITGGWTAQGQPWTASLGKAESPSLTTNSGSITLSVSRLTYYCGIYYANNKINLTNVRKLCIKGFHNGVSNDEGGVRLVVCKNIGSTAQDIDAFVWLVETNAVYELPVEELSGEYVVGIQLLSGVSTAAVATVEYVRCEV